MSLRQVLLDLLDAIRAHRRLAAAIAGLLLLDAALAVVDGVYLSQDVARLERVKASTEGNAARIHEEYSGQRSLSDTLQSNSAAAARFRNEILGTREERYVAVKKTLERLAGIGTGMKSMKFRSSTIDPGFVTHSTTIHIEGPYGRVRKLLSDLQSADEFLMVDGVDLTLGKTNPSASIAVSTAYSAERAESPGGPAAPSRGGAASAEGPKEGSASPPPPSGFATDASRPAPMVPATAAATDGTPEEAAPEDAAMTPPAGAAPPDRGRGPRGGKGAEAAGPRPPRGKARQPGRRAPQASPSPGRGGERPQHLPRRRERPPNQGRGATPPATKGGPGAPADDTTAEAGAP